MSTEPKALIYSSGEAKKKGRSFQAYPLAYARWDGKAMDQPLVNPLLFITAASTEEMIPFRQNVDLGRPLTIFGEAHYASGVTVELQRSAGYLVRDSAIEEDAATVVTWYLPEYVDLLPPSTATSADGIAFVTMPAHRDLADVLVGQEAETRIALTHLAKLGYPREYVTREHVALAAMVVAQLVRRGDVPIPDRLTFRAQLLFAALAAGHASFSVPSPWREATWGQHKAVGYSSVVNGAAMHTGVAVRISAASLEALVVEQVRIFERAMRPATRGGARGAA